MEKRTDNVFEDEILRAAKRKDQAESRELVRSGARTQDSMAFIPRDLVRASRIRRRTDEF
jgi:hypothetical protein